jgi:uncharacterized surface anchored protein
VTCPPRQIQDPVTCQCRCKKTKDCPGGQIQDPETCICACPGEPCPQGQTRNPATCRCECAAGDCATGALEVKKVGEDGQVLAGACFDLLDAMGNQVAAICDNDPSDAQPLAGVIRFETLPPGDYTLVETQAPVGFQSSPDQVVSIFPNDLMTVTVANAREAPPVGDLRVVKMDATGQPLGGACLALLDAQDVEVGRICDNDEQDDDATVGVVLFRGLTLGIYHLREVQPPPGFVPVPDQAVEIQPGETVVSVVNMHATTGIGDVVVEKVGAAGEGLGGACFILISQNSGFVTPEVCDEGPQDSLPGPGILRFTDVPAGDYLLRETQPPAGYQPALDQLVIVRPGETTQVRVSNGPQGTPAPASREALDAY